MFKEEVNVVANAAASKVAMLKKNPLGYFVLSMLAGAYVGLGILLIFSIGGQLGGAPYTKTLMGAAFGIALSLVVIAGSELFTGNNMVMSTGIMKKTIGVGSAVKLWIVCWLGNLMGGVVLSVVYHFSGLGKGAVGEFMAKGAMAKISASPVELLMRAILCNFLVCLAVWCGMKCKSESGKLIMIFWCLFAFITTGYEHSVANMTLLTVGLLNPAGQAITVGGYFYNLGIVTLGNMIGGILCVAVPYVVAARDKD